LLLSPRRAGDRRFVAALRPLVGAISLSAMQAANLSVDRDHDKVSPAAAAEVLARSIRLGALFRSLAPAPPNAGARARRD
jgi:osmoprotectant transport system permease protein